MSHIKNGIFLLFCINCCCLHLSNTKESKAEDIHSSFTFTHQCGEDCELCIEGNEHKCLVCNYDQRMVIANIIKIDIRLGYNLFRYAGTCVKGDGLVNGVYLKYKTPNLSAPDIVYYLQECPEEYVKGENGICCPKESNCITCATSEKMSCLKCDPDYHVEFFSPISSRPSTPYFPEGGECIHKSHEYTSKYGQHRFGQLSCGIENCTECLGKGKCSQCIEGYYLYSQEADNKNYADKCMKCDQEGQIRLKPWVEGPKCIIDQNCPDGSYYNKKLNACQFCGNGCINCNTEGKCTECFPTMTTGIIEKEDINKQQFYCMYDCGSYGQMYTDMNGSEYCILRGIVKNATENGMS